MAGARALTTILAGAEPPSGRYGGVGGYGGYGRPHAYTACKPGWGVGDRNHGHSAPPAQANPQPKPDREDAPAPKPVREDSAEEPETDEVEDDETDDEVTDDDSTPNDDAKKKRDNGRGKQG